MKKILILSSPDPNISPRPNRMIHWLKSNYNLTVVGGAKIELAGVRSFHLPRSTPPKKDNFIDVLIKYFKRYTFFLKYLFFLLTKQYENILWAKYYLAKQIGEELSQEDFDLIISHDIVLLPLAFAIKENKTTKILLDAREYYPKNFEDSLLWRLHTQPINKYLCEKYLHRCNKIITVSDGLAKEYAKEYNINPKILMSLPYYADLEPTQNETTSIRMIYHGNINPSRKTELMIEMMGFVDERFTLDLMLVNSNSDAYWRKIKKMADKKKNVRLIPPVQLQKIVPFTNSYDIGVFLVPPSNFNLKFTLPNKFFEFIQARLAVAIGPSIEMSKLVKKYDCGIISEDFTPHSLAQKLNKLTPEKIIYYKNQSHKAAQVLNADTNKIYVNKIIASLLRDEE